VVIFTENGNSSHFQVTRILYSSISQFTKSFCLKEAVWCGHHFKKWCCERCL